MTYQEHSTDGESCVNCVRPASNSASIHDATSAVYLDKFVKPPLVGNTLHAAVRGASACAGRESVSPATSVPVTTAVRTMAEKKRALDMETRVERPEYQLQPHAEVPA
jgi:hypothetical protein